jgi:hypothetical protein
MSTPTKKRCIELIRLCAGCDFFPADAAVRELLVNTLQRVATSDEHAGRIIDAWLERERRAPLVVDLCALAKELPASKPSPTEACERCLGAPFITTNYSGQGFAARCTCARGRYLLSREREERAKRAA